MRAARFRCGVKLGFGPDLGLLPHESGSFIRGKRRDGGGEKLPRMGNKGWSFGTRPCEARGLS